MILRLKLIQLLLLLLLLPRLRQPPPRRLLLLSLWTPPHLQLLPHLHLPLPHSQMERPPTLDPSKTAHYFVFLYFYDYKNCIANTARYLFYF